MKGLRYIISMLVAFQCLTMRGQDSICAYIHFPIYGSSLDETPQRGFAIDSIVNAVSLPDMSASEKGNVPEGAGISDEDEVMTKECPLSSRWTKQMSIKSNLPVWLAAMPNIAFEFDMGHHFSIAVAAYYSGWDYFKSNVKFRNLTVMPELRYWPRRDNAGFFMGIHGGVSWYNVALGGDRRWQDHDGNTPALGGGINLGYKFPLRSRHWSMEVSVGAGAYKLDYDIFMNEHNGIMINRRKRMFYGIDKAALSICYHFGLRKKGGMP